MIEAKESRMCWTVEVKSAKNARYPITIFIEVARCFDEIDGEYTATGEIWKIDLVSANVYGNTFQEAIQKLVDALPTLAESLKEIVAPIPPWNKSRN